MKNDWEKKATCSAYLSSKIFATSAWDLTLALPWVRSNGPTDQSKVKEYFTQNSMKPRMMTDAVYSAIHNSSSKEN
jgi:hypothetical protein